MINSNVNQTLEFENSIAIKIVHGIIRFCFDSRRLLSVKMSAVKRKLKSTKILQKCKIIKEIERGMTNKEASEKFGIPKNTNIYVDEEQGKAVQRVRTKFFRSKETARLYI